MTFIDDKINSLSLENKRKFEKTLRIVLKEDKWMELRGFDIIRTSYSVIKAQLYEEMFERYSLYD